MRNRSQTALLATVTAGLIIAGCTMSSSFFTTVNFDESAGIAQLRFRAFDGTAPVFGPVRRPDTPTRPMHSSQTVLITFPDSLSGKAITLVVDGIREEQVVAHGSSAAVVRKGKQTTMVVNLDLFDTGDGGCATCAGCCSYGRCYAPTRSLCGSDGGTCFACDNRADRCLDGACACGDGGICALGLECDAGVCQCTSSSCQGCCDPSDAGPNCSPGDNLNSCGVGGNTCARCINECDGGVCSGECDCPLGCCSGRTCYAGNQRGTCGSGGFACAVCAYDQADCIDRVCRCGNSPACGFGQVCQRSLAGDSCVCTPSSCPSGCCTDAGTCSLGVFPDACGSQGGACVQCDPAEVCQFQRCVPQ